MLLLLLHAGTTCFLAGLVWVVQLVVYPGFVQARTGDWAAVHEAHARRMSLVVGPPWAVQGLTLAALLVRHDAPLPLLALTAALALATVVVTLTVSVPLHSRLTSYDEGLIRRLVTTNWWRTAAWTGGAVCSLALVAVSASP